MKAVRLVGCVLTLVASGVSAQDRGTLPVHWANGDPLTSAWLVPIDQPARIEVFLDGPRCVIYAQSIEGEEGMITIEGRGAYYFDRFTWDANMHSCGIPGAINLLE